MANESAATRTALEVHLPEALTDPTGRKRVYANPPRIRIGHETGHKVTFKNKTNGSARLWLPHGANVFDPPSGSTASYFDHPIEIPAGDTGISLTVTSSPKHGTYQYHVYCATIAGFAEGSSAPEITVP